MQRPQPGTALGHALCPQDETGASRPLLKLPSVPETDPCLTSGLHQVMRDVHTLELAKRLLDGNRDDMRRLECHHVTPLLVRHGADGRAAETSGQQSVISGR